jgi:hypothetical protein
MDKMIGSIDDDLLAQIIKAAESKMSQPFAKKKIEVESAEDEADEAPTQDPMEDVTDEDELEELLKQFGE